MCGGRHTNSPDSDVRILDLCAFCDTKLNFHRVYLDTDWGILAVAFMGVGVTFMTDLPVHGMMEKLQRYYHASRDDLVEMLGIDLNCRRNQLSDEPRRRVHIIIGMI